MDILGLDLKRIAFRIAEFAYSKPLCVTSHRLMADVQYKVGATTFVNPVIRRYLPAAEQEHLRLYYEELNESMVIRSVNRTSDLFTIPLNLREGFVTRLMEIDSTRRAEFMMKMRRFEVSAQSDGGP